MDNIAEYREWLMGLLIQYGVDREIYSAHKYIPEAMERGHVKWVSLWELGGVMTSELLLTNRAVKYLERYG